MKMKSIIFYNALVILVLLAGLELCLFLLLKHPGAAAAAHMDLLMKSIHVGHMNEIQNTECSRYDDKLFYTLRPGVCKFDSDAFSAIFSNYVKINSKGLRDEEDRLESPEIIVLGDSHAMGWGVNQEETFAKQLEKLSNKKTLNAGISSYGTAREVMLLSRLDQSKMKYLIVQYCANDLNENVQYVNNGGKINVSAEIERYTAYLINKERVQYYPFRLVYQLAFTLRQFLGSYSATPNAPPDDAAIQSHVNYLVKTLEMSGADFNGVRLIVFPIMENARDSRRFVDALREMARQAGLPWLKDMCIVDPSFLFVDGYALPYESHFNAAGHAALAAELAGCVKQ